MGKALVPAQAREAELERMMQTYGNLLAGLCTGLLRDRDLAQDVVQETFVRAWRKMDDLRGGQRSEKAWLCRIAVNLCRDQQRTRWFRVEKKAEPGENLLWCQPPDETSADVMEALSLLKPKYREALTLHYLENLSTEELGQIIGLSPSAVYRRLNKAKRLLKELLKGWENDG